MTDPYLTQKRYRLRRARHGGNLRIDVAPYREQLLAWREQGWSYPAIAQAAGVDVSTIQRISGNDSTRANLYVRREVAKAIDEADFGRCHGVIWIPAIGWTVTAIVDETGISRGTINSIRTSAGQITAATHQRLAAAYERLSAYPQDGTAALRARRHAHRQGWAPPAAWDNIDDPTEQPSGINPTDRRLTAATLVEESEHFLHCGMVLTEVLKRLNVRRDTLRDALARHGRQDIYRRLVEADERLASEARTWAVA